VQLTVVGNPGHRRVELFRRAVVARGLPEPSVLPWRDVLTGTPPPPAEALVRVESPGEDAEVDRLLRQASAPARHGELIGLAAAYAGLIAGVTRVAHGGARLLTTADDVATLCDKRRCHAVLLRAGVPVPPALPPVNSYQELRSAMRDTGLNRVFVKPAHGSSASGVLALETAPGRVQATTTVEIAPDGLFNVLRPRRYRVEREVAALVDRLACDGLHVERWLPKASLDGRVVDVRVVAIAGRPTHLVVRSARGPLTNLHLGNRRGDVDALKAAVGPAAWGAALLTCEKVAGCFPRSLQVGIDLMFLAGGRGHAVAEVNAFGDLLPGVLADGRDTYAAQVDALVRGWADRPVAA
jgi:hypothetical protein